MEKVGDKCYENMEKEEKASEVTTASGEKNKKDFPSSGLTEKSNNDDKAAASDGDLQGESDEKAQTSKASSITEDTKIVEQKSPTEECKPSGGKDVEKPTVGGGKDEPPKKRLKAGDDNRSTDEDDGDEDKMNILEPIMPAKNLRKFQHIPIFIVDYHNDVLEFIYRCLATRHLPLKNNILIHFDSHPDMVISREIPASASYDKETMLAELSIENWIMPTCFAGYINRVIWLKNSWCQQIPIGKYNFKVGQRDDKINVDCPIDYFIAEGNYCDTEELEDTRDMELHVYNADLVEEIEMETVIKSDDANNFILDIDLDFFSTSNPFLEIYKDANCYEQLTDIFHYENDFSGTVATEVVVPPLDCSGATDRRKKQLEALKRIFEHLEEVRTFEGLAEPDPTVIGADVYDKIKVLANTLKEKYGDDEIDWLLIYDSGNTTDTKGLPHHISTTKELELYISYFKKFLERLPVPPVLITMACSAEDDYCPKDQVAFIQEAVLRVLAEVFGDRLHKKPILHYLDDEWDVMKL